MRLRGAMLKVTPPGSGCEPSSVCLYPTGTPSCHLPPLPGQGRPTLAGQPRAHWMDLAPQGPPGCPAPMMDGSGGICFQRGCQGQGPDKGLLWLWFPLPHHFPQGAMLGLPGPVFPLLSHSLHSSRSFSPGLVGGSAPPCAWPSFPLCSQVLAMGSRTPLAPVVPSNFCLALLVCPGASPHFLSLRCPRRTWPGQDSA